MFSAATASAADLLQAVDASVDGNVEAGLLKVPGHTFDNGQAVTYRASNVQAFSLDVVNVTVVGLDRPLEIDGTLIEMSPIPLRSFSASCSPENTPRGRSTWLRAGAGPLNTTR